MIINFINKIKSIFNSDSRRDLWVINKLRTLKKDLKILDAGCGSQRYKKYCSHLQYYSQDFGKYTNDLKRTLSKSTVGGYGSYEYGMLDYIGDIWDISEKSNTFDYILCTEVFEHIPYPEKALKELSRLLKVNGCLILTLPSTSLRHMDPFYFYSGFSDRWLEHFCKKFNLKIIELSSDGDYYSFLRYELYRTMRGNILSIPFLIPSFIFLLFRRATVESKNTLNNSYFLVAKKQIEK